MKLSNFWLRTIVGIIFLIVMVGGILAGNFLFYGLMAVIMSVAMTEFFNMTMGDNFHLQRVLTSLAGLSMLFCVGQYLESDLSLMWLCVPIVLLIASTISFVFNKDRMQVDNLAFLYAGFMYIAIPIALSPFLVITETGEYDGWPLLCMFILIWASDVGAYCIGSTLGHMKGARKLAPSISPNKTWWGFAGALVFSTAAAVALHYGGVLNYKLIHCILLGLIVGAAAVVGDLVESLWKRHYGLKDTGKAIPGHGGMLDRFDSSLVAIPLAAAYLILIGLI